MPAELSSARVRPTLGARVSRKLVRIYQHVSGAWEQLRWTFRWALLNLKPGVHVSYRAFISPTARIELRSVGLWRGGTVTVEAGALIHEGVVLTPWGGDIRIKANVFLGPYCVVYGCGHLTIGRDTLIAGHSFIVAGTHQFNDPTTPIRLQPVPAKGIDIGSDCWLGAGVRVIDGVTIGDGSVVGAGAVVTKSLHPLSIAVGVPARVIGTRGRAQGNPKGSTNADS